MSQPSQPASRFILPEGCQVVVLREVSGQGGSRAVHPRGAVGIVVKSPDDRIHSYRVRFTDGMEEPIKPDDLVALAHYKNNVLKGESSDEAKIALQNPLFSRVMSQFKKMQADLRNQGQVKPKHVMHLIRLLISGIGEKYVCTQTLPVDRSPFVRLFSWPCER